MTLSDIETSVTAQWSSLVVVRDFTIHKDFTLMRRGRIISTFREDPLAPQSPQDPKLVGEFSIFFQQTILLTHSEQLGTEILAA